MYKIIKIGLLSIVTVGFLGCGGGGSGSDSPSTSSDGTVHMQVGVKYVIQKGSTVQKKENDTVIVMETDLENKKTYVTLQKGAADLTYIDLL